MIAMIESKAVQTPRGRRTAANADNFPCSGRKPLRGAFIWSTGANAAHGGRCERFLPEGSSCPASGGKCAPRRPVDSFFRPARTKFHVRDENRSEGRSFGSQGRMRPTAVARVFAANPSGFHGQTRPRHPYRSEASSGGAPLPLGRNRLYSPVTRIQSPIKENLEKNAFLQNQ